MLLTKKETKTYKSKYPSKCAILSKRNSQDGNKDEQQLKHNHPNDIVEVTKYDTDIPDKRFFGKFCYGSSSGKKVSAEKICLYARIHFSKRVTALNKKDWGKEQMFLKPFWNIWQMGSARCLEYMANGGVRW